jgi:hypothetical protein
MDNLLLKIVKEYETLEENCDNNFLLNYGLCENGHFTPHYPGLIQDFLPSSSWYNSRHKTLPMYLQALKKENLLIEKNKLTNQIPVNQTPKLYILISPLFDYQNNQLTAKLENNN